MPTIETLGEALQARWGVRIKCHRGEVRGMVKRDRCAFECELDMQTLVCTRGRGFPLARLASRLRCPNCGETEIQILFDIPGNAIPAFVPQVHR